MERRILHIPVLLEQAIEGLNIKPDGVYIDATFGQGGHSAAILQRLGPEGKLLAFDVDREAFNYQLKAENFILIHSSFIYIPNFLRYLGIGQVDGILADLGISTLHVEKPERGFSYRYNAPLDMRMNPKQTLTAADIVNSYDESDLVQVFKQYAQVQNANRIAQAIVQARQLKPIKTTFDLVQVLDPLIPKKFRNKTLSKIFQALRIEVNDEIENLKRLLEIGNMVLKPGGRFVIISFHSVEDRIVKNYFKTSTFDGQPQTDIYGNRQVFFRQVNKKVIVPSEEEIAKNPRSRSAKLRIAEKL